MPLFIERDENGIEHEYLTGIIINEMGINECSKGLRTSYFRKEVSPLEFERELNKYSERKKLHLPKEFAHVILKRKLIMKLITIKKRKIMMH